MQIDRSAEATPNLTEVGDDEEVDISEDEDDPIVTHPPLHLSSVSLSKGELVVVENVGCYLRADCLNNLRSRFRVILISR